MITLSDLVALSRSYFKALALYNHDDIIQQQGFDDIKHGDSKAINTLFAERIDTLTMSLMSNLLVILFHALYLLSSSKMAMMTLDDDVYGMTTFISDMPSMMTLLIVTVLL